MNWITKHVVLYAVCFLATAFLFLVDGRDALAATRFIEYLYVEANEGDSSGGHVAIRFETHTFHFQHDHSGIIRIRRIESAEFDHVYALLGNRTIQVSRIAVSDETYALLQDGFTQFVIIQDAQLDILDALRKDVALYELLLEQVRKRSSDTDISGLQLKGLGYFLPDEPIDPLVAKNSCAGDAIGAAPLSASLIKLRDRISATYGEPFLAERITQAKTALHEIDLCAALPPAQGISKETYPGFATSPSARYEDALLVLSALELLRSVPQLRPGVCWSSQSTSFMLAPEEILFLKGFAEQLENDLVRQVKSSRSDWGFPFIAGMARLAAVEASLLSGRLVLLDIFSDSAPIQDGQPANGRSYLPAMKNEAEKRFIQRRREFFASGEVREANYAALEQLGNQLAEIERAMASGTQPRRFPTLPLPSRKASPLELVLPDMDEAALKRELEIAGVAEKNYAKDLANLYSYNIVRRNCVTEIFTSINSIFESPDLDKGELGQTNAAMARKESLERLGGFLDASRGLNFIPFVSAGEVAVCYSVVAHHERPSYRAERLAEMKKHESPLMVFLRESNTITSTIYRPSPANSAFLFFTDDTILLRPLFGAFNLLVGLGQSLFGLVTIPVDGSKQFLQGMKGMLFSLPELVFVNIRKGSMAYVEENP